MDNDVANGDDDDDDLPKFGPIFMVRKPEPLLAVNC